MMSTSGIYAEGPAMADDRPAPSSPPARDVAWLQWNPPRMLGQAMFLVVGYAVDVLSFALCLSLFCAAVGTLVIWVGVPLLVLTLFIAGGFATLNRQLADALTGGRTATARYRHRPEGTGVLRGLVEMLRDPQRWIDLLWTQVNFVVSTITFTVAVTWIAGTTSVVVGPALDIGFRSRDDVNGLGDLLGLHTWWTQSVLDMAIGIFFLVTLPAVLRGLCLLRVVVNGLTVGLRAGYEQQIGQLQESRAAGRQAEARSLRRLEQDIHDGPQQGLIRLQLDLARAQRAAATDPERAASLLTQARSTTGDVLAELRSLSRGIAPPVLVDRGLDAALAELAARSEVGVVVTGQATELPDHVATAAYFVAAECLTNVNKHSRATSAEIAVAQHETVLELAVIDNGCGGASLAKGHGLAGLAERLLAVDGDLTVDSPSGGPTRVTATMPLKPTAEWPR